MRVTQAAQVGWFPQESPHAAGGVSASCVAISPACGAQSPSRQKEFSAATEAEKNVTTYTSHGERDNFCLVEVILVFNVCMNNTSVMETPTQ